MTVYRDIKQRSPEWFDLHSKHFTASVFDALMPTPKQKVEWNDRQEKIIYQIAAARMGAVPQEKYKGQAVEHGKESEDEARDVYEMETGNTVEQVGFIELDDWIGCSPDGLIREDGYWEAKCPNSDTHLRYLNNPNELEEAYAWQVRGGLWISDRKWAHIMSYDPRFSDPEKQLVIEIITRDAELEEMLINRLASAIARAKEIMGG